MKVDVRNMLKQSVELLGKRRLDEREEMFLGVYQITLGDLADHLGELGRGEITLDEFCEHYCLDRSKSKPITSLVPIQNPEPVARGVLDRSKP